MNTITVNKIDLIKKLEENRAAHREQFLAAQVVYRKKMIEELDRMLREAREGSKIRRAFSLPEPTDFTSSFDVAIKMLEWEQSNEIELDQRDFEHFVLNKWSWDQQFATSTTAYLTE